MKWRENFRCRSQAKKKKKIIHTNVKKTKRERKAPIFILQYFPLLQYFVIKHRSMVGILHKWGLFTLKVRLFFFYWNKLDQYHNLTSEHQCRALFISYFCFHISMVWLQTQLSGWCQVKFLLEVGQFLLLAILTLFDIWSSLAMVHSSHS